MNQTYKIKSPLMLSFLTPQDQYDTTIDPTKQDVRLAFDGKDIWLLQRTINSSDCLDLWLEDDTIKKMNN